MALRQRIEWDPEEVVAGYDLSSIYEEVDDNSTAPVISSVVNTTDQAGPVFNITAGINSLVEEVVKKLVAVAINATTTTPITPASSTVVPLISSTPSTISHLVKKAVEHLGREPSIPVATVRIYYFCVILVEYFTVLYSTICTVYDRTVLYTSHHTLYIFVGQRHFSRLCVGVGGGGLGRLAGGDLPGLQPARLCR